MCESRKECRKVNWIMAYVEMVTLLQAMGCREMTGSTAIKLAEKAHMEGRFDEARGLGELAYRLFDDAADVVAAPESARKNELYAV